MFKFLKWLFSIKDDSKLQIKRKVVGFHGTGEPLDEDAIRRAMTDLLKVCDVKGISFDDISKRIIEPMSFSPEVMEHVLRASGFQKTVQTPRGRDYDPRLISLVTLSLNVYYSGVSKRLNKVVNKLDNRS